MIYNETNYYCSCKIGYYSNSQLPETQLQSGSHCQRGQLYAGSLQIAGTFNQQLNNTNTTAYKTLQKAVLNTLTAILKSSPITKSNFERIVVTGFKAGSIIAEYDITFKQNTNINPTQLTTVISTSGSTIQGQPIQNATVTDYNECANIADHTCKPNQICVNIPGSYNCQCKAGYTGPNCVDINECALPHACANNTVCLNTLGSYSCSCQVGYHGNPYSDTGCIGACTLGYCLYGGTCYYVNSERTCSCLKEFTGTRCATKLLQTPNIIAISVGAVAALIVIVLIPLLYYLIRRARRRRKDVISVTATTSPLYENNDDLLHLNTNIELNSPSHGENQDANVEITDNLDNNSPL